MLSPRVFALTGSLLAVGCFDPGEGVDPPLERIYFPVGVAVSPGGSRLYVASSNFDLQYNGGALQAFDLERVVALVPRGCRSDADCSGDERCDDTPTADNGGVHSHWCVPAAGPLAGKPCGLLPEKSEAALVTQPGRCGYVSATSPPGGGGSLVRASVGIGAFATDVLYRSRPNGPGGRLFIPVRGDATLHYVDVLDDSEADPGAHELFCGQTSGDPNCDDSHRRGDDPEEENTRGLRLAQEPFGIAGSDDGSALVITHQTEGTASLFVNDAAAWGDGVSSLGVGPKLEFALGGLPRRAIGVAALPDAALVADAGLYHQPGFLVTFRDAAEVRLLRYFDDSASQPPRPFISSAGTVGITANSLGFDSRGIAIDPGPRRRCEATCPADAGDARSACLTECSGVPLGVFAANRTPSSLLIGRTRPNQSATSSDDLPAFYDSIPLTFGPSRVIVGEVLTATGERATRVFVVCFDSRKIGVYDPEGRRIEKWIETGRGPHAFAPFIHGQGPGARALGYVGHFTDSYVGVIELDQRSPSYGTQVLMLGRPSPPRTSK